MIDQKEITQEMKAKIFGQYLGSKVLLSSPKYTDGYATGTLCGVNSLIDEYLISWDDGGDWWVLGGQCQLILKPLEDVASDKETCLGVAAIFGVTLQSEHATLDNVRQFGSTRAILECTNIRVADYLRSRGYHLPYMGIDLYASSIAVKPKEG